MRSTMSEQAVGYREVVKEQELAFRTQLVDQETEFRTKESRLRNEVNRLKGETNEFQRREELAKTELDTFKKKHAHELMYCVFEFLGV